MQHLLIDERTLLLGNASAKAEPPAPGDAEAEGCLLSRFLGDEIDAPRANDAHMEENGARWEA